MGYGADIYGDTHKVSYQPRRRRQYGEAAQHRMRLEADGYMTRPSSDVLKSYGRTKKTALRRLNSIIYGLKEVVPGAGVEPA